MYVSDDYRCVSSRSSKAPYATGLGDLSLFSVISQTTLHYKGSYFVPPHARSLLQVAGLNTHTTLTQTVELTALFFQVLFVAILRSSEGCSNTCSMCVRGGRCLHNIVTHAYVRYALGSRPEKNHAHLFQLTRSFFNI